MPKVPRISDSEWKVMEVVWADPPVTAMRVSLALGDVEGWKPQTVKTLLGRLVKKGVLRYETEGNRYLYSPVVGREAAVAAATGSFLDLVARGSIAPLLAQLVESHAPLQAEEIAALRALLKQAETDQAEEP